MTRSQGQSAAWFAAESEASRRRFSLCAAVDEPRAAPWCVWRAGVRAWGSLHESYSCHGQPPAPVPLQAVTAALALLSSRPIGPSPMSPGSSQHPQAGRLSDLQEQWGVLYKSTLPRLAKARHAAQPSWPVYLDHCFARILLDNAVGIDKPWTEVVEAPAIKNMSGTQLRDALRLGNDVANGTANLDELNRRSLDLRGKRGPKRGLEEQQNRQGPAKKARSKSTATEDIQSHFRSDRLPKHDLPKPDTGISELLQARETVALASDLTDFRRFVLILLTFVPRGRYTTYGAMSAYITSHYHKSSARAIGNAMRNNPFAPTVPCHRVLAHDGRIGGFCGDWGEQGKHAVEKKRLLAEEGVRFDSRGKVLGKPYADFEEHEDVRKWYARSFGGQQT